MVHSGTKYLNCHSDVVVGVLCASKAMVQKIFEVVRAVADKGMTVLLVEQNAKLALEVSQRGYVMESGEITLTGESARLLANPKVREAYLGE